MTQIDAVAVADVVVVVVADEHRLDDVVADAVAVADVFVVVAWINFILHMMIVLNVSQHVAVVIGHA